MNGKSSFSVRGVLPPIPTPFDTSGRVAYGALRENLQRWNQYGLAGYVVLGSNGEAAYLRRAEKVRLLEAAREAIPPDKLLIAGTGCESTQDTIRLTQQAAEVGADAALVVTPNFYDGKMSPNALVKHFTAVADASPIPVLLYNVPKFTHVDMAAATVARTVPHPNIKGIKDSSGNITKLADTVRLAQAAAGESSFDVLAGSAGFLFAALAVGAVGGVVALSNIAPQQCVDIYDLFGAGRWDEAADLQRRMVPVNTAITATYGVAGLKAALDMLGFYGGPVRAPLLDLGKKGCKALQQTLSDGGLL
jgi:4-hydroxy-2-oxoglutarate aldolase